MTWWGEKRGKAGGGSKSASNTNTKRNVEGRGKNQVVGAYGFVRRVSATKDIFQIMYLDTHLAFWRA